MISLVLVGVWFVALAGVMFGPTEGRFSEVCAGVLIVATLVFPVVYASEIAPAPGI